MTMLLSTNFDGFSGWTSSGGAPGDFSGAYVITGKGCGGGKAFTCTPNRSLLKRLDSRVDALTIRQSFALYSTYVDSLSEYGFPLVSADYGRVPAGVNEGSTWGYGFTLAMNGAGGLRLYGGSAGNYGLPTTSGGAPIFEDAADGTLPPDGRMHALEVGSAVTPGGIDWIVAVDGVTVMSGSASLTDPSGYCMAIHVGPPNPGDCDEFIEDASFSDIRVYAHSAVTFGGTHPTCETPLLTASAHCEIEDAMSVGAYTPCTGAPTVASDSCCQVTYVPPDPDNPPVVPPGPPKIPLVKCAPQSIISSPAPNAGCSKGGTGWRRTYNGPSGTVPIGADPVDGETMTGKTTAHLWIEITHTSY